MTPDPLVPLAGPPDSSRLVSALRHQLRTPLNHIIGYAEILLQEWTDISQASKEELERICEKARSILDNVNALLPAGGALGEVDRLREALAEPSAAITRSIGSIAHQTPAEHLLDLLRINIAAGELLAFSERKRPINPDAIWIRSTPPGIPPRRSRAGQVLVVDDDEANRELLSRQLQRLGHAVTLAEDGPDALRQLAQKSFDAVLLDVVLPRMDGMAVLQKIKCDPRYQNVPVIMISALDELKEVATCLEAGAEDYLTKPFEPVLLSARVNASLERKRLRDIEQERSREIERSNEEVRQFAYVLSHDLQEPLRTMSVYAQLLTHRWRDFIDRDSQEFLGFIVEAAQRMRTLVEDVLSFSRCAQKNDERAENVDLNVILRHVLANLAASIRETGAAITIDLLPTITAWTPDMTEIIQNLIANAIKYCGFGKIPEIHVSSRQVDGKWVISVEDNGVGVPPDSREKIFLPFNRLHGSEIAGNGIGLAICRKIVEKYGGRIWVESGKERGSVFRFTLPAVNGES